MIHNPMSAIENLWRIPVYIAVQMDYVQTQTLWLEKFHNYIIQIKNNLQRVSIIAKPIQVAIFILKSSVLISRSFRWRHLKVEVSMVYDTGSLQGQWKLKWQKIITTQNCDSSSIPNNVVWSVCLSISISIVCTENGYWVVFSLVHECKIGKLNNWWGSSQPEEAQRG